MTGSGDELLGLFTTKGRARECSRCYNLRTGDNVVVHEAKVDGPCDVWRTPIQTRTNADVDEWAVPGIQKVWMVWHAENYEVMGLFSSKEKVKEMLVGHRESWELIYVYRETLDIERPDDADIENAVPGIWANILATQDIHAIWASILATPDIPNDNHEHDTR